MRTRRVLLAASLSLLLLPSCTREQPVSTAGVEAAFEVIADTNRVRLERVFTMVRNRKHAEALTEFREIRRLYKLTPSQDIAVQDIITQLEQRVASARGTPTR